MYMYMQDKQVDWQALGSTANTSIIVWHLLKGRVCHSWVSNCMLSQSYLHVYVMARQLKKEFLAHTSLVVSKSSLSYCDVCIVNSTSKACMFVNRNKL